MYIQAFIEHLMKPATQKRKAVKYRKSRKRQQTEHSHDREALEHELEDHIKITLDEGEVAGDQDSDLEVDSGLSGDTAVLDADRALHDTFVIKETTTEAVQFAQNVLQLAISDSMLTLARGVLTKVSDGY